MQFFTILGQNQCFKALFFAKFAFFWEFLTKPAFFLQFFDRSCVSPTVLKWNCIFPVILWQNAYFSCYCLTKCAFFCDLLPFFCFFWDPFTKLSFFRNPLMKLTFSPQLFFDTVHFYYIILPEIFRIDDCFFFFKFQNKLLLQNIGKSQNLKPTLSKPWNRNITIYFKLQLQ